MGVGEKDTSSSTNEGIAADTFWTIGAIAGIAVGGCFTVIVIVGLLQFKGIISSQFIKHQHGITLSRTHPNRSNHSITTLFPSFLLIHQKPYDIHTQKHLSLFIVCVIVYVEVFDEGQLDDQQ